MPIDRRDPAHGTRSRGPCHLYVFPCAWEDLLKLGFSRDPLTRLQQLHPRWFEFFDLDRAISVETESVPDARKLELAWRRRFAAHNAPMPLTIRDEAGGGREWFRGAQGELDEAVEALRREGHIVHAPLRPWLREALRKRAEVLFAWTSVMLDAEALAVPLTGGVAPTPQQRAVRDALDAFDALGIALGPWLPEAVLEWHRASAIDYFKEISPKN